MLDLNKASLQVPLSELCRNYTAFIHRGRQYRFTRTPFGLTSSGAPLARALKKVLGEGLSESVALHIHVCIFSKDLDYHIKDVGCVLQKLQEAGFTIKPDKIQLARKQVEFFWVRIFRRWHPSQPGEGR